MPLFYTNIESIFTLLLPISYFILFILSVFIYLFFYLFSFALQDEIFHCSVAHPQEDLIAVKIFKKSACDQLRRDNEDEWNILCIKSLTI